MQSLLGFPKKHIFHIYAAIIILFTSWIIYYGIPKPSYLKLGLLVWIFFRYPLKEKGKLVNFLVFSFIALRATLPFNTAFPLFEISNSMLLGAMFIIPKQELELIFKYFLKILVPIIVVGLIQHILLAFDINLLPQIASLFISDDKGGYEIYPLLVYNSSMLRFSSIFNEPGYLGTFAAFILIANNYNLKDKRLLILFMASVLTLSLSFYFLSLTYFVLRLLFDKVRKVRMGLVYIVVGFYLLITFGNHIFPDYYSFVETKINYVSGEGFSDSRANISSLEQYVIGLKDINAFDLYLGVGDKASESEIAEGHVSWINLVLQIGLVLTIVFIGQVLSVGLKSRNVLFFGLIFILSINHRPQIFELLWFFLLSYGISIEKKYNN